MLNLLITCRDVGAAFHLLEVSQAVKDYGSKVSCHFVAQEPALSFLEARNVAAISFDAPTVTTLSDSKTEDLLVAAAKLFEQIQPDAVLVGLSGMNAGLDEAILKVSEGKIPRFAFQDSWGDINFRLQSRANCYFVLDELAAELTQKRDIAQVAIVGAPKYAAYKSLDLESLKATTRNQISTNLGDCSLIGFFGQPLHEFPGYTKTLETFINTIENEESYACYFPHPKEGPEERKKVIELFRKLEDRFLATPAGPVESLIAACDLVLSCFSSVCYDHFMLQHYASKPIGSAAYLMVEQDICQFHHQVCGLALPPPVTREQLPAITSSSLLKSTLKELVSIEENTRQWKLAKEQSSPHNASSAIVDKIIEFTEHWP